EARVLDAVRPSVPDRARDEPRVALHTEELAPASRERQREVAEPAVEIEDPIVRSDLRELDCRGDHLRVDDAVDLNEIGRREDERDVEVRQPISERTRLAERLDRPG